VVGLRFLPQASKFCTLAITQVKTLLFDWYRLTKPNQQTLVIVWVYVMIIVWGAPAEAAKKLAKILDTTVGYLLGETEQADLFKDPKMLKRLQDILNLPEKEKESLLLNIDHFIKAAKISLM